MVAAPHVLERRSAGGEPLPLRRQRSAADGEEWPDTAGAVGDDRQARDVRGRVHRLLLSVALGHPSEIKRSDVAVGNPGRALFSMEVYSW